MLYLSFLLCLSFFIKDLTLAVVSLVELVVTVEGDEQVPGGGVDAGVGQPEDEPEHGAQPEHLHVV